MTEADKIAKLYHLLQQRDELKKQRKLVDSRQILLDDAIKRAERRLKNDDNKRLN